MRIYSLSELNKSIDTLSSLSSQVDSLTHEIACSCVYHSIKDGQITPARDLLKAMGRSSRRNDLITWLTKFGNFTYTNGKGQELGKLEHKLRYSQSEENAQATFKVISSEPFWKVVTERKPLEEFDLKKALASIVGKVTKYQTDEKYKGKVSLKHLELLEEVKKLAIQ